MKPNFQLAMYPTAYQKGISISIAVTNKKTRNPLANLRICDATECEGKLAIKKHETKNESIFDVKETTPLAWEGGEKTYKRLPAAPLPAYLQAFEYDLLSDSLVVRISGGKTSRILTSCKVDVLVQIESNEKTIARWLRDVDLVQCIRAFNFPPFVDDC
jgi:hypothetical protein